MARILLLTGLAGAGRTTAADILEDMGFYVMENLPAAIVEDVVGQVHSKKDDDVRLAIAVDLRDKESIETLYGVRKSLRAAGDVVDIVFLDADDDTIIRRFEQTRRPHPYISAGVLTKGIEIERDLLSDVLANADVHIDTTVTNPTQLGQQLSALFSDSRGGTTVVVQSFGFKHGAPRDADYVIDVRFLPNPFWDASLKEKSGLEDDVQKYVRAFTEYGTFLESLEKLLMTSVVEFSALGKGFVSIAVGCTGGVHRSVTVAQDLSALFRTAGYRVITVHRELDVDEFS
jgi:UPF0042 nucleotide-binding protein